jgi:glycosyltransferase involved in cell wall biosynthesis
MRIAIDGRALSGPAGGVRRYVTQLWRAMPEVAPHLTGVAIGGSPEAAAAAGLTHAPASSLLPTNLGWSAWTLPRAVRASGADVCHAPAYTAPLWGARPLVLTIHDVSYARHPEWYPHTSDPVRQWFYRRSAHRADRIITDSTFSRDEIVAAYGIATERIDVIPLGVGAEFTPDPARTRDPVVLHVGDLHTRRNLRMLVDVVADLTQTVPGLAGVSLVLVGTDRGEAAALKAHAAQRGIADRVQLIADASDAALLDWYRRASVLAYPSRYEGFGLPVLEAMACGTPVIASRGSSLTEVVGEGGLLVGPDARDEWGRTLRVLLEQPAAAREWSQRGLLRAAQCRWTDTARHTAAVYQRVSAAGI